MKPTTAQSLARVQSGPETNWQQQYRDSITCLETLCSALHLDPAELPVSTAADRQFPLRVPWNYVRRIQRSDPNDPLLLQVLPHAQEENESEDFRMDAVGDLESVLAPGLLKKYNGRVLLLATSRCAVHCRFCFRRHFPYSSQNPRRDAWLGALRKIAQDSTIREVILSGGDPLVLDDGELAELVRQLESIPHVMRLRIHTRLPVVIPARINSRLIEWVNRSRLKTVLAVHVNHPREIDSELQEKLTELSHARCHLLNQSVLLRNINDHPDTLARLSEKLFDSGVLPYYLHLPDKVQNTMHFEVREDQARKIMDELSARLPGYLVPKLVKEQPGHPCKTPLGLR